MGQGLGKGLPSARTRRYLGGLPPLLPLPPLPPPPPPQPTPRSGPIGPPMSGPVSGSWVCLATDTLTASRVRRRVLREGVSGNPTYCPWLSSFLKYWNNTGIRPPRSDMEAVMDAFTHTLS